jgi:hypothetical protein
MSANALRAGFACLNAFALSTKSCSSDEAAIPVAMVDGEPPDGGPLVSGTGGGGVNVRDDVVDDGVDVRG